MKPVSSFLVILIVSALAVSACMSPAQQASPSSAMPSLSPVPIPTTVKIAYMPSTSFGPIYIAQEEGYFAKQGINVEFEKFTSNTAALPLLLNGEVVITGGPVSPAYINAMASGEHVRVVADKGSVAPGSCPAQALMVRRDLFDSGAVRNVSDLKGRKLMGVTGDTGANLVSVLEIGNLTRENVDIVNMDYPSAVVAFQNKAIDAAVLTEPYITQTLNSGSAVVLLPGDKVMPGYALPLFYGPTFLDKNPELGKRFMVAYLQGVKQYNKGKTERNLEIMAKYTFQDRQLLNQSCWYPITNDGIPSQQSLRDYIDWMYAHKMIPQNINDNQLYDMSFITYANGIILNTTSSK
jgi:NitT/TauT family transport system substrate-binding protein